MNKPNWNWIQAEPGKLVLDGTPFDITYNKADPERPFTIHRDGRVIKCISILASAKEHVEFRARELLEMGLIELEDQL